MNILEKLMGNGYPKFETSVCADSDKTTVIVHRTLSPDHADLDSPTYIETKFKKNIPILKSIWVSKHNETDEQTINVAVEVKGEFNSLKFIKDLVNIAADINKIAEDRLSEPEAIKNIGLYCKPFICTGDESEEEKHEDA